MSKNLVSHLQYIAIGLSILSSSLHAKVNIKNIDSRDIYVHEIVIEEGKQKKSDKLFLDNKNSHAKKNIENSFAKLDKILKKKKITLKKNKLSVDDKNIINEKITKLKEKMEKNND